MIAIYARVSTEEQMIKGYGIGNQIDECLKKIGNKDHILFKDEGISGEVLERPGLTELRDNVQAGVIDEIVCYDPDRLSRKLMHQLMLDDEFRKKGVKLIFVNGEYAQTPEGQLFFSMRGAIAEFEKEKIKQRTKGGKLQKAKQGKLLGNYHLYGYDFKRHDSKNGEYVINPDQAKVVKMIFDYFTEPTSPFKGINGIAKHLTEIGIPTAKGGKVWHRQVVRQILMNLSYTGKHPQNKYDSEGDYVRKQSGGKSNMTLRPVEEWLFTEIPAIISEEQYNVAQELLKESRRRYTKSSLNQYLLSGLIRCKDCGNTMNGRKEKWWGSHMFIYSCVKNTAGAKNIGCGNRLKVSEVDDAVWEHISDLLNNPDKIASYEQSDKVNNLLERELSQIEKELEKNKKGRQRLVSLVAMSDDIDLTDIKQQLEEMSANEKTLQKKYTQLQTELKASGVKKINEDRIKATIEYYMTHSEELTFEEKKSVIRSIVKQIYVSKEKEIEIHLF